MPCLMGFIDENDDDDNNDDSTWVPTSFQPQPGASSTPPSPPSSSPQWSSSLNSVSISDFTSPVGPTVTIPECPLEVFERMFTPSLMDAIVEQTNLYAKEVIRGEKYDAWYKVTTEKLKAYFGFCILMGINRLPALDDYWSSDLTLRYPPPPPHC